MEMIILIIYVKFIEKNFRNNGGILQYGYWIDPIKSMKEGRPVMAKLELFSRKVAIMIQNVIMNYLRMVTILKKNKLG